MGYVSSLEGTHFPCILGANWPHPDLLDLPRDTIRARAALPASEGKSNKDFRNNCTALVWWESKGTPAKKSKKYGPNKALLRETNG